jgi:hypothetical protein
MARDSDHELDIRIKIPATMDRNDELGFLVAASVMAVGGLVAER